MLSCGLIFGRAYYWREFCLSKWAWRDNKNRLKHITTCLKKVGGPNFRRKLRIGGLHEYTGYLLRVLGCILKYGSWSVQSPGCIQLLTTDQNAGNGYHVQGGDHEASMTVHMSELQSLENSRSYRQGLEFSTSWRQYLEFSTSCRQDLENSRNNLFLVSRCKSCTFYNKLRSKFFSEVIENFNSFKDLDNNRARILFLLTI